MGIIVAVGQIVLQPQLFVGVVAADQPVELAAKGLALQAKLLGEGLEPVRRAAVVGAVKDIEIVEVGILAADIIILAIGGNRG